MMRSRQRVLRSSRLIARVRGVTGKGGRSSTDSYGRSTIFATVQAGTNTPAVAATASAVATHRWSGNPPSGRRNTTSAPRPDKMWTANNAFGRSRPYGRTTSKPGNRW